MTEARIHQQRNEKLADMLDSGEFKQGHNRLRRKRNHFCCIGVACELYRQETGDGEWLRSYAFKIEGTAWSGSVPVKVGDYYGWLNDYFAPEITIQGIKDSALTFNDKGCTFSEIADGFRHFARSMSKGR